MAVENSKRDNWVMIIAVVVTAIIIWLLLDKRAVNRVVEFMNPQTAVTENAPDIHNYGLPSIEYAGGGFNYNAATRSCIGCYSGYQRIITPQPAIPYSPPAPQTLQTMVYNYINVQSAQTEYQRPKVVAYNY